MVTGSRKGSKCIPMHSNKNSELISPYNVSGFQICASKQKYMKRLFEPEVFWVLPCESALAVLLYLPTIIPGPTAQEKAPWNDDALPANEGPSPQPSRASLSLFLIQWEIPRSSCGSSKMLTCSNFCQVSILKRPGKDGWQSLSDQPQVKNCPLPNSEVQTVMHSADTHNSGQEGGLA